MPMLSFPDPQLADGDVLLRPWRKSDDPQRFEGFSDPMTLRFSWPLTEPFTEAHVAPQFEARETDRLAGTSLNLAIVDASDPGKVWGGTSFYDVDLDEDRASVGYWVAHGARGRGVATRTLRLMAGWGFTHLGLARLELTCGPDNVASQRVAEKCGFVREGVLRSHMRFKGGRRDTVVFSLLPGEFH
jgi:RimJ/RimL family protein N-acetyltransferase